MELTKDLSVILPAYLEEENLRLLLPRITKVCSEITSSYEVIVVDTEASMDGTPNACAESKVEYFNRTGGNTYGAAIRTGISMANGKKIIFMDADGSHHPEFIKKLYHEKDGSDVIIASRYMEGGHTENSPILILMSKIVNWGFAFVLNIKCKDVSNSFRLYDGEKLKELTLKCENFDIVEEVLYKLLKKNKGLKIKEIPFSFKQRMFGETKRNLPKFIMTYIFTLIKLRFMKV
ncbi:putative glycosyl transferase protein [Halobacteriovorax marinus SJ]|uniref:Glycosyl transferase protein n=1 Tax=Halobacteriovorax marinus (strain ATCC BAA-682 / DSM 15412 / SJ) TaxID=862908 RepID=E1X3V6_HALMS|nr:glycosyltransferase [Halobacteriovorax marinus]CBW25296.1 putative glycosyl transferase protein [Halobacteriovorax marinus SJ]